MSSDSTEDIFGNPNPFGKEVLAVSKKVPGFAALYRLTRELTLHRGVFVPKDYFKWNIEYGARNCVVVGKLRADVIERGPDAGKWLWEIYGTRGFEPQNSHYTSTFSTPRGALTAFVKAHKAFLKGVK